MCRQELRTCFRSQRLSNQSNSSFLNLTIPVIFLISRLKATPLEDAELYLQKIQRNSHFQGAYGWSLLRVLYLNSLRSKKNQNEICKEVFMTIPKVIFTRKDFFLLDPINDKIKSLKASGLVEYWSLQDVTRAGSFLNEENRPKVLTIHDFDGCYQIFSLGIFISFSVFLIEVLTKFIKCSKHIFRKAQRCISRKLFERKLFI